MLDFKEVYFLSTTECNRSQVERIANSHSWLRTSQKYWMSGIRCNGPADVDEYYTPDDALTYETMRPCTTFNDILAQF